MAEKIANFRLNGYKIIESSIILSEDTTDDNNLQISIEQTFGDFSDKKNYIHRLTVNIQNKENSISIRVKAIGYFEFDSIIEDKMQTFAKQNAPAILFPYIRAHISAITGLSGILPIIIPTINLSSVAFIIKS